jgi:hypothetical protein
VDFGRVDFWPCQQSLISVEFSILIGVALSILMFVPRAALLRSSDLIIAVKTKRS